MSPVIETTAQEPVLMSQLRAGAEVDPSLCVAAGLRALAAQLSPGMAVSSLTLDLSPLPTAPDSRIVLTVRIEKSTRSVAFTSVEARTEAGATVFGLRVLCARPGPASADPVG